MNRILLRKINELPWNFQGGDFGFFTGKSGCSLALFVISKKYNDVESRIYAEKLLQETIEEMNSSTDLSIDKGILGVALVINFLIYNRYIDGDVDEVLGDVDALLYKNLKNEDIHYGLSCTSGLVCFLVYLVERIGCTKNRKSLCANMNEESLRTVINKLGQTAMPQFVNLTKDVYTSIINDYPILFLYLGKAIKLGVYSDTIYSIAKTWTKSVTSYLPYHSINRLYLAISLSYLNQSIKNELLEKYIKLLLFSLDMDDIYKEVDEKIMNINEGAFFIEILLWASKNQFKENDFQKKTAALQIKLKTAIPPLYDRFIEKFPSRDCDLHFINGILGVETLRILYPFIFE